MEKAQKNATNAAASKIHPTINQGQFVSRWCADVLTIVAMAISYFAKKYSQYARRPLNDKKAQQGDQLTIGTLPDVLKKAI